MRFKKGSIVEVLCNDGLPSGSWRCGEVVSGKGHNYAIKYKMDSVLCDEAVVERVSKKSIRPFPPSVETTEDWAPGDVLEVFQSFVWKMATVCTVLGRNEFMVRLVGFSHEFNVCRNDLRVRQSWQDGRWFVIGKNVGNPGKGKRSEWSLWNHNRQLGSQIMGAGRINRKRGISYAKSEIKVPAETPCKFRLVLKEGTHYRLPEKVVNIAFRQGKLDENHAYTVFNNRNHQYTNQVLNRGNLDGVVGRSCQLSLNHNDEDSSITCSVGSCSIASNDVYKTRCCFFESPINVECNDAESVCCGGSDEANVLPTRKECINEIRRLERHAYRCTIEALHACGPLSWEQETMVTTLRLSLNISNDEHLMELKNLASTATSLSFR